jgi:hypothetical protein
MRINQTSRQVVSEYIRENMTFTFAKFRMYMNE